MEELNYNLNEKLRVNLIRNMHISHEQKVQLYLEESLGNTPAHNLPEDSRFEKSLESGTKMPKITRTNSLSSTPKLRGSNVPLISGGPLKR